MDVALRAHQALGCRGATRADLRYDDTAGEPGRLVLLEVNTQPGLTPDLAAAGAGRASRQSLPRPVRLDGGERRMPRVSRSAAPAARRRRPAVAAEAAAAAAAAASAPGAVGLAGFVVVLAGVLLAHSAQPGGMLARAWPRWRRPPTCACRDRDRRAAATRRSRCCAPRSGVHTRRPDAGLLAGGRPQPHREADLGASTPRSSGGCRARWW